MHGLALASGVLFGLATPASKILLQGAGPFVLAGLLYLGAAAAIGVVQARIRAPMRPTGGDRWQLVGSIIFGGFAGPVLLLLGLREAQAGSVSIWLNLELVWTAVLGVSLFGERLGRWSWAAVGLVLVASVSIALEEPAAELKAGAFVALACLAWGFDNQFTARITSIGAPAMTLWKGAAAGSTNLAIGLSLEGPPELSLVPWALAIGAVSYGLSIIWYVIAARRIGATRAQVSFSTAPLWGVAAAILVLEESWTWQLGAALALVGAALGCLAKEGMQAPDNALEG